MNERHSSLHLKQKLHSGEKKKKCYKPDEKAFYKVKSLKSVLDLKLNGSCILKT